MNLNSAKSFLSRLGGEISRDHVSQGAASLAFYFTLATFPALITVLSLVPYLPVEDLQDTIRNIIYSRFPASTGDFIFGIANDVIANKQPTLLSVAFLGTIWAASSGMIAVIKQLNIAFGISESRGLIRQRLTAIFTVLVIASAVVIMLGREISSSLVGQFQLGGALGYALGFLQYVLAFSLLLFAYAFVYYVAPNAQQKFKYLSPGALVGCVLIILMTVGFDFYVENFGNYNKTYGSIGGMIVYMLWLYINGFVLLLGAEVNNVTGNSWNNNTP